MKNVFYALVLLTAFNQQLYSQSWWWTIEEVATMPMKISNNAVVEGWANDTGYVFSFGGIDSTKIWSGITLKSFRYNTISNSWDTIPSLPDATGKIASAASYVDSIIYIIGGYHVLSNGNEISSNKVHRYNPRTNTYLSDATNIPVAIDDHVQAVWNDSLIYVISGWSNTTNVPNVQIYNPTTNTWLTGTATPNTTIYKAFGASGVIINNTIYYHGGASTAANFPAQSNLRIGQINPADPTQITWSVVATPYFNYRSLALKEVNNNYPHFIGGSSVTYNFNGIAYNGSGGVNPTNRAIFFNGSSMDTAVIDDNFNTLPMDLRGVGTFLNHPFYSNGVWYIAGGMSNNQQVSDKTFRLIYTPNVSSVEENKNSFVKIYPNPSKNELNLMFTHQEKRSVFIVDALGKQVFYQDNSTMQMKIDVSTFPKGIYVLNISSTTDKVSQKIVIQ